MKKSIIILLALLFCPFGLWWMLRGCLLAPYMRVTAEQFNQLRLKSLEHFGLHMVPLDTSYVYGEFFIAGEKVLVRITHNEASRATQIITNEERRKLDVLLGYSQGFSAGVQDRGSGMESPRVPDPPPSWA